MMELTVPELEAIMFAISEANRKALRDRDLVRDEYKNTLRLALGKLQDEHIRITEPNCEKR